LLRTILLSEVHLVEEAGEEREAQRRKTYVTSQGRRWEEWEGV